MKFKQPVIAIIPLVFFFFYFSCSDKSVSPKQSEKTEATAQIGPNGGILATDNFQLTIPSGAWESTHDLNLVSNETVQGFEENAITKQYTIENWTEVCAAPFTIKLKYSEPPDENSYILIGHHIQNTETEEITIVYSFVEAVDSAGYLIAEIPSEKVLTKEKANDILSVDPFEQLLNRISVAGCKNYPTLESAHFNIKHPGNLTAKAQELANHLETCYTTITQTLAFEDKNTYFDWPVNILIRSGISNAAYAYWWRPVKVENRQENDTPYLMQMEISRTKLEADLFNDIVEEAGPGLLRLFIDDRMNPLQSDDARSNMRDHIFINSALKWSEEFFTLNPDFVAPSRFEDVIMAPICGLNGVTNKIGYCDNIFYLFGGNPPIIKYPATYTDFGIQGLAQVFEQDLTGITLFEALLKTVPLLPAQWWPTFIKTYVSGSIYGVDPLSFIRESYLSGTWKINSTSDTQKSFTNGDAAQYFDFSSKLFKIELDTDDFSSEHNLIIDADGQLNDEAINVLVFNITKSGLQFLGESVPGNASIQLADLKDYYDNGWREFLVVVVNSNGQPPYESTSNIDLTFTIKEKEKFSSKRCRLALTMGVHRLFTTQYSESYHDDDEYMVFSRIQQGEFNGNTFTANYSSSTETSIGTMVISGTLSVTLNDDYTMITETDWEESTVIADAGRNRTVNVSAINIPVNPDPVANGKEFVVHGTDVGSHITHFTDDSIDPSGVNTSIVSYAANEKSRIILNFME